MIRLILILSIFIPCTIQAQSGFNAGMLLGINGGRFVGKEEDLENFFNEKNESSRILLAYNAGFFVSHRLKKNIFWRLEIKYNLRGINTFHYNDDPYYSYPINYSLKLHCVEIPLIIYYELDLNRRIHYFNIGFIPGRITKAVLDDFIQGKKTDPRVKKFEYGLMFGYTVSLRKGFFLNLSVSSTLNSVIKGEDVKIYSKVSSATLEYHF